MTREETITLLRVIKNSYPNFKMDNPSEMANVWHMMLDEYDYKDISRGLKAYIATDTTGFAPSIGQVIAKASDISKPQELGDAEAWAMVWRAICNSNYHSAVEFGKLPKEVQNAVGSPEQLEAWAADPGIMQNIEVAKSNFIRSYRAEISRKEEFDRLPESQKKVIASINSNGERANWENRNNELVGNVNVVSIAMSDDMDAVEMPEELKAKIVELLSK